MRNTLIHHALIAVLLTSCTAKTTPSSVEFPDIAPEKNTKYTNLNIETLSIFDSTTSFIGKTFIDGKHIYFADQFFNYVYEFNTDGTLKTRHLGSGKSDNELQVGYFSGATMFNDDSRTAYLGNQIDIHLYDPNFKKLNIFQINNYFNNSDTTSNIYDIPRTYSYATSNFVVRGMGDAIYLNLRGEAPGHNCIENTQEYYTKAHPIMKVGLTSQNVEGLLWQYPPAYTTNYSNKGLLFHVLFDIDNVGNFYLCSEADSTIYQYDKDMKALAAYGFQGRAMDTNYSPVHNFDDANRMWDDTRNKGLYQWIEYIDQTGLLFRSYSKSQSADSWGLQVFSKNAMLADVDVPVGFKVIGYISPYYYGEIIADPDNKTMKISRFKLDEK